MACVLEGSPEPQKEVYLGGTGSLIKDLRSPTVHCLEAGGPEKLVV